MATMIPATPTYTNSPAERDVWYQLAKFPDDVVVFHSYHWTGEAGSRDLEGEIDFVMIDPAFGVMVIEVKGGAISHRNGRWLQGRKGTSPQSPIDPYGQASKNLHFLRKLIGQRVADAPSILFGYLVWFPDVDISTAVLPPNSPALITLDRQAVSETSAAFERALSYWRAKWPQKRALTSRLASEVVALLDPEIELLTTAVDVVPAKALCGPTPASHTLVEISARPWYRRAAAKVGKAMAEIAQEVMLLPVRYFIDLITIIWDVVWSLWRWCWRQCKTILQVAVGVGLGIAVVASTLHFVFHKQGAPPWILGGIAGSFAAYATHHLCEQAESWLARLLVRVRHRFGDTLRVQF
jgi:hypothetical protein